MGLWRLTFSYASTPWQITHRHCSWKNSWFLSSDKEMNADLSGLVDLANGSVVTWLAFLFYYHLRKIAFLYFCPGAGISVHCLVLAYQYYISLLLSVWPDHTVRYNKMWLLWISFVLCHASLNQCSALTNFGMPFNTFFHANLSYFWSNFYEKMTFLFYNEFKILGIKTLN